MSSTIEHITLNVPDVSCDHCVATVQDTVGAVSGVSSVTANADSKQVQVAFDSNRVSLAEIETALDDVGYPVSK